MHESNLGYTGLVSGQCVLRKTMSHSEEKKPSVMMHTVNPGPQDAETKGSL